MKLKKFAVPFAEDKRMLYAKEYLENDGFEYKNSVENADFVLLPVPAKKYMFDNLESRLVFFGSADYKNGFDYAKYESYALQNAFLTAEGAITLLEENTPYSLLNSKILIIGYGRIGKALHKLLKAYEADVTVCSRSKESAALAKLNGAKHITFNELTAPNYADIIINTVPHIVLTMPEISVMKKDAIILELASFPGGVDNLAAKSRGITVINGKSLPAKYTEKTAGYIIGHAVANIIEEEFF